MQSVPRPEPQNHAFYAQLSGASGLLGKLGPTVLFLDDLTHALTEVTSYKDLVICGRADIADCQQIMDRLHGGYAAVACQRRQEVA